MMVGFGKLCTFNSRRRRLEDGDFGWSVEETPTEVRLIPRGVRPPGVETVLGEASDAEDAEERESSEQAFGLEYQLRDFLAQNISSIDVDGRRLRLYVDPTGRDGIEFQTAVGSIDILAIGTSGDFYVFELKRGLNPEVLLNPRRLLQHFQRPTPSHVSSNSARATRRAWREAVAAA